METKRTYTIVDYLLDEFLTIVVTNDLEHTKRRYVSTEFTIITVYGNHNQLHELDTQWNTYKSKYDPEYVPALPIHARMEDKKLIKQQENGTSR